MMLTMTKTSLSVILALAFVVFPVMAEDWTTTDGKVYQGVKVVKVEADSVTILDSDGGARLALADLPPDLQKRFHYDPDKAKQASEERAKIDAQEKAQMNATVALEQTSDYKAQRKAYDDEVARIQKINQENRQYTANGGAFAAPVYPIPEFKYRPPVDLTKPQNVTCRVSQVASDGFLTENLICPWGAYNLAFIKCDTTGMIDGQQWHGQMIPFNTYRYVTVVGNTSTIPAFTTDLKQTASTPAPSNYVVPPRPVSSLQSVGGG
jgi:hypothetical protein